MAPTILTMPAEILLEIAFLLDLDETYQLRNTSKGLFEALNGETFNQKVAKHYFSYSKEAQLAKQGIISYSIAIQRIFRRRKALPLAQPCSVVVLARGGGHGYYNEGFMSYIQGHTIRVLDVHNASPTENIIDLKSLLHQEADRWPPEVGDLRRIGDNLGTGDNVAIVESDHYKPMINHYHNGMISVFLTKDKYHVCAIINVQKNVPSTFRRVRLMFGFYGLYPQSRFTGRHLFLAANRNLFRDSRRNRRRPNGIDEWVVWRFDLEVPERPPSMLHLAGFSGGNFYGDACTFDIYSGWFYALCPINLPVSADNKKAFYCCYRIPVEDICTKPTRSCDGTGAPWPDEAPLRPMQSFKIPRPCEGKGIIREAETLKIIRDEQSGNLVITEDREEWGWEVDSTRSCYYFQQIRLPDPSARGVASGEAMIADMVQNLPEDDVAHNIPQHPYPPFYFDVQRNNRRYVQPSSAFVVTVSGFETADESSSQQSFHLYVGSRPFTAPIDSQAESLRGSESIGGGILSASHYDTHLAKSPIRHFPPKNAPKEVTDLLNPFSDARGWVASVVDERSVIIVHGETDLLWHKTTGYELLLINFDPWIRFPGLENIDLKPLSDVISYEDHKKDMKEFRNWIYLERMTREEREESEREQAITEGARNENRDQTSTRGSDHPSDEARSSESQDQTSQETIDAEATNDPQSSVYRDIDPIKERGAPEAAHEATNSLVSQNSNSITSTIESIGEHQLSGELTTSSEPYAGGSATHQLPMETEKDFEPNANEQSPKNTHLDDVNDPSGADAANPENNVGTDTWFWTEEAQWVGIKRGYQFY